MSEERLLQDYLNDIHESIRDIKEFTKGLTFDDFAGDRKTIKAVIRSLEVIGEAAGKIPDNIRESYPAISWGKVIGMRNKLIHEYFGVDLEILWQTIEEDLVPLEETIMKMLAASNRSD